MYNYRKTRHAYKKDKAVSSIAFYDGNEHGMSAKQLCGYISHVLHLTAF